MTILPPRVTRTHQVVAYLQNLIVEGQLDEGAELPSQGEIAESLGVSRLIVREATRALEARGLIHAEQGRRLTVARPDANLLGELFTLLLQTGQAGALELLEVRRALELHFVRLAAQHATDAELETMQVAIGHLRTSPRHDIEAQADADGAFHDAVAAASGNQFMRLLAASLGRPLRELRLRSLKGSWTRLGSLDHAIEGHTRILAAIDARDGERAATEMGEHLRDTWIDLQVEPPADVAGTTQRRRE